MKRFARALGLDTGSERNIEEIGSGSTSTSKKGNGGESKDGSGSRPRRRYMKTSKGVYHRIAGVPTTISGADDMQVLKRRSRQLTVQMFNNNYVYGAVNSKDQGSSSSGRGSYDSRTLIWSGGCDTWPVASSGITWVSVYGVDMVCVVTKKDQHLDKARLRRGDHFLFFGACGDHSRNTEKERILRGFMLTIAPEMEDPSSELRQRMKHSVKRSFAAVSVALGTDAADMEGGDEASIVWPGKDDTINFLKGELENDPALTHQETIQMAICALEYLHKQEFSAGDILVDILMEGEELDARLAPEKITQLLEIIHRKPSVGWPPVVQSN